MVKIFLNNAKQSTTNAIKTASKSAIQKKAEATGDFICNKIADNITSVLEKSSAHSKKLENDNNNDQIEVPKKDAYLQKKANILLLN